MSGWYGYCDDRRKHEREAQEDARYGSRSHQPDRWEDDACYRVYSEAYRAEEYRQQERAAEEAAEQQRLARQAEERDHARYMVVLEDQDLLDQKEREWMDGLVAQARAQGLDSLSPQWAPNVIEIVRIKLDIPSQPI